MEAIQRIMGGAGCALATVFTQFGEDLTLIAVLGVLYWGINKEWAKKISVNFIVGLLFGSMIKNVVGRRRPYMDHDGIDCLKAVDGSAPIDDVAAQGFSFPSLHSTDSFTIYGTIATLIRKRAAYILCGLLVLTVGISRVMLGVHYPTDVLLGWLFGFVVMTLMNAIQKKCPNRTLLCLGLEIAALPGWFFCTSNDFFTGYGLLVGIQLAFLTEERFVHFKNTKSIPRVLLRVLGGIALFLVLDKFIKLFIPSALRSGDTFAVHLVRAARYFVISYVTMGLYPMVFRHTARFFKK